MASLNTLKLDIKTLERTFPKNHERFRILNASVDELTCRFIGNNGKNYDIQANITVIIDFYFALTEFSIFIRCIVFRIIFIVIFSFDCDSIFPRKSNSSELRVRLFVCLYLSLRFVVAICVSLSSVVLFIFIPISMSSLSVSFVCSLYVFVCRHFSKKNIFFVSQSCDSLLFALFMCILFDLFLSSWHNCTHATTTDWIERRERDRLIYTQMKQRSVSHINE